MIINISLHNKRSSKDLPTFALPIPLLTQKTLLPAMEPPEYQHDEQLPVEDEIGGEFESAEKLIMKWDSISSDEARERMIFNGDRREADRYLQAVDEIQRSISTIKVSDENNPSKATSALQIAMVRLEDEFRHILISHSNPIETHLFVDSNSFTEKDEDQEEEDGDSREREQGEGSSTIHRSRNSMSLREIDLFPSETIYDLRRIAERMIFAGYSRECIQVYGSVRKSAVDGGFRQLGVEKLSIGDIQKLEWETLETKIRRWIRAAKVCVRFLFASEKRLCDQIFDGLSSDADADADVADTCFMDAVKGSAIQLFNFAEAISISRRSPEKLFKILDLHDSLLDLLPDMSVVFGSKSSESFRIQAEEILSRLAEAARGILSEFENAVQREPSRVPVPGGTIHPLTRYVMNYVSLISDYKQTLIDLIVTKPSASSRRFSDDPAPEIEFPKSEEDQSPLALHLIWIIVALQFNLESKSKVYKDTALSYLFLMNNVHYIVQKAKGSLELREMIGDDYLKKLTGKFRQLATSYQRATWKGILYCLRDEGIHVSGSFSSGVSKPALRERFKSFNSAFEEAHRVQGTWLVPDPQLREELRISMSENILPAYRSFLGRFRHHLESGKHSDMYIKYSVEDLESALMDFFEGSPVPLHIRRRSN
ncbi:exocyst complex component EXO70B1-like [Tasmannia lanceolata]|uniref:exocyst complex component EXO70B1-like n=1 Tax=Tasmannia lanceolata TaxID=3420 RepID=UPI004064798F